MDTILTRAQVFSRMTPNQKRILVERLQELGSSVAFCGDGANDCGALGAAHVGLSLSEAEASVAAPFTSKAIDIGNPPLLLCEGRGSLVASFSCFKYMGLYSIIQFITIILLYYYGGNLGDGQFLLLDLCIILPLSISMGRTGASQTLLPERPTSSLVSKATLVSFLGQCIIALIFQSLSFFHLLNQPWYQPEPFDPTDLSIESTLNTTLFHMSAFQYLWGAITFSCDSTKFRTPIYTNPLLVTTISFLAWILLSPMPWQSHWLELVEIPTPFRYHLILLSLTNLVVAYLFERYAVPALSSSTPPKIHSGPNPEIPVLN